MHQPVGGGQANGSEQHQAYLIGLEVVGQSRDYTARRHGGRGGTQHGDIEVVHALHQALVLGRDGDQAGELAFQFGVLFAQAL